MHDHQLTDAYHAPRWLSLLFLALAIVGGIAFIVGLWSAPQQAWSHLFLAVNFLVWLAVGALVLISLDAVAGARWSVPLRRLQEACVAVLPVAGFGLLVVLVFHPSLFGAMQGPAVEGHESPLRVFWQIGLFRLLRALIFLGVWLTFAAYILRSVRKQEQMGGGPWSPQTIRLAAGFLVVFGVTCWLASDDWLISLQAGWTSTIFGVYNFAGAILSALAAVTLLTVALRHCAPLRPFVTGDRLQNLGSLLFGFSSFWMYTWFCQYLLIWYTNHPNETNYLRDRWQGQWPSFVLASAVLNWGVPFLVLLSREARRNGIILAVISVLLLAGRWLDLFVIIGPSQQNPFATPGLLEAGIALGAIGVLGLSALWSLKRLPLVPANAEQLLAEDTIHLPVTSLE